MHTLRQNHYTTLSLSAYTATPQTIWSSYLSLSQSLHPSKSGCEPCAREARLQLDRAIEVLGSPERREKYDVFLQREMARGVCFLQRELEGIIASLAGFLSQEMKGLVMTEVREEYATQVEEIMARLETVKNRVERVAEWLANWLAACPANTRLEMTQSQFEELQLRCGEARMCRMFMGTLERLMEKVEQGNVGPQVTWWGGLERIVTAFEGLQLENARGQ